MNIAYLTAGAGGMYCGSCMQDNAVARALLNQGVNVQLIPLYMPIQTDQPAATVERVFFSGINVYLRQYLPLARYVPGWAGRLLEQPRLLRWAGSGRVETSPRKLGKLAVSMLRGQFGAQRVEAQRLAAWLRQQQPIDALILTNALIAGCVPLLKQVLDVPVLVILQGDDVFLDGLPEPYRQQALTEISRLVPHVAGFLVHSDFYADKMSRYLSVPRPQFTRVPLALDTTGYPAPSADPPSCRPGQPARQSIGYLARLTPEKGLHRLIDAFLLLKQRPTMRGVELVVAGWLGPGQRQYAEAQFRRLRQAGLGDQFRYLGAVDHRDKLAMLSQLDVLSVPTEYEEPKGLYVLEALAAGVPVVQPAHGAFPELLQSSQGGRLVPPGNAEALANTLHELLVTPGERARLGHVGQSAVHRHHSAAAAAEAILACLQRLATG